MKLYFVRGIKYIILLLIIHHERSPVSTGNISGVIPSLHTATVRLARNNRPYIPLNSFTFQAAHNDGTPSWMNQGPTILKQMLKKSKLGGSFKDGSDSVQGLEQERRKYEMQESDEDISKTKESGAVSVLIGHDKSIINVPDNYFKMKQEIETRKIDGSRPKISSQEDLIGSHENNPLKKSITLSGAVKNVYENLTNNNETEHKEVSLHNQSLSNGSKAESSGSPAKTIFNRRFIPSASKVKLAELEKTKPSKANPESNIIWIFTTPEHTYTLSGTTASTLTYSDMTALMTETTDSPMGYPTESEFSATERGDAEASTTVISTYEAESYHSTVAPDNEDTQEVFEKEGTVSTPEMITSDDSINTDTLTTDLVMTTKASINTTYIQINEVSTPSDSTSRPTTRKSSNEFLTPTSFYQFTRTYPVSTKKEIGLITSSPFIEGFNQSNIIISQQSNNDSNKHQTPSLSIDSYDSATTTPVSSIVTIKLLSPSSATESETDHTSSYPTELDILKEIKKVFQSLSNDINLQTGAAINKDSNENPQNQNSYFNIFDSDSYTKTDDKNSNSATETNAFFQTQTEENFVSVLDSRLGNLKTDNKAIINSEDSPDIVINNSKPYPIIGLSYVNNTTPSTYLTKYDNPYSQYYTPLVQLNVWNYLNGHLQLTETQAVPSPTIDIINSPEVTVSNDQKQSVLLLHQGAPNSNSTSEKVFEEDEWLSNHQHTITTELNKLITSAVPQKEKVKPAVDPFEFINILSYLEEQISSPSTTTETLIPENIYEFVMKHNNINGSNTTRDHVRGKIVTTEAIPTTEHLKITNYKFPVKTSSSVFHSPPKKLFTTTTVKSISTNKASNIGNETNYSVSKDYNTSNVSNFNDSERPSLPKRNETTLPVKTVVESSGGIFNNTYLPSFLQIYQQQNNQNSHLVTNHLNTQQFITINNHPTVKSNNSASNGIIINTTMDKVVTKTTPLITINNNIINETTGLSSSLLTIKGSSSPASLSPEESIYILSDSNQEPSLIESYPRLNTSEQKNNSSSSIKDPLLNIDSATLVKEYITRISIISQFFKQYDVTNPETATIIENLALKSLLSYILGEEDVLAHELNKKVLMYEPISRPLTDAIKNENSISQSTLSEAEYEISIVSKLAFDAVLQDGDGQNLVNQLPLLQNSNSIDDVNNKPIIEIEGPLEEINQEDNRPLLLAVEAQKPPKQEESFYDALKFDWLLTTVAPEIDEPLLEEELDKKPSLADNIKNSVTDITGMISNLVPTGSTFQNCLNKLGCSFALASSLAIGATGIMAIPLILPFGRKKKQVLFEESRIFGHPIHEHDGSSITDQKLKSEFKRVLTYLSHPDEHKTDKRINEMKGNLIKYLKEEYDKIQNERRLADRRRKEHTENKKQSNEYKLSQTKYQKRPTKNYKIQNEAFKILKN